MSIRKANLKMSISLEDLNIFTIFLFFIEVCLISSFFSCISIYFIGSNSCSCVGFGSC
jgi:hypothetical protein